MTRDDRNPLAFGPLDEDERSKRRDRQRLEDLDTGLDELRTITPPTPAPPPPIVLPPPPEQDLAGEGGQGLVDQTIRGDVGSRLLLHRRTGTGPDGKSQPEGWWVDENNLLGLGAGTVLGASPTDGQNTDDAAQVGYRTPFGDTGIIGQTFTPTFDGGNVASGFFEAFGQLWMLRRRASLDSNLWVYDPSNNVWNQISTTNSTALSLGDVWRTGDYLWYHHRQDWLVRLDPNTYEKERFTFRRGIGARPSRRPTSGSSLIMGTFLNYRASGTNIRRVHLYTDELDQNVDEFRVFRVNRSTAITTDEGRGPLPSSGWNQGPGGLIFRPNGVGFFGENPDGDGIAYFTAQTYGDKYILEQQPVQDRIYTASGVNRALLDSPTQILSTVEYGSRVLAMLRVPYSYVTADAGDDHFTYPMLVAIEPTRVRRLWTGSQLHVADSSQSTPWIAQQVTVNSSAQRAYVGIWMDDQVTSPLSNPRSGHWLYSVDIPPL